MQGRTIAVLTDRQKLWRRLSGPLTRAGGHALWVRRAEAAAELFSTSAIDLVLLDPAVGDETAALLAAAGAACPIVAVAAGPTVDVMGAWRGSPATSLLARLDDGAVEPDFDPNDVFVAAGKLLRGELFGLEKHLSTFGAALTSRVVTRADDRDGALAAIETVLGRAGVGERRARDILGAVDELVTNAVYDAPRTPDGRPRYLHVDRREKLVLAPTEYVTVRHGVDGQLFGVSVTDAFGALDADRLASCFTRGARNGADQIEHKAGGAGLGLYLALRSADHLVVAVEPGRRTEVTALWRLDRRGAAQVSTLSYLVGESSVAERAVPTIEVSESARYEIRKQLAESTRLPIDMTDRIATELPPELTIERLPTDRDGSRPEILLDYTADPLAELRGVHLLRQASPPGLDTTLARLRGLSSPGSILTAITSYLLGEWSAALVLEADDDALRVVCLAGDVEEPESAALVAIARTGRSALAYLARQGGLMLGPLAPITEEAALARYLQGDAPADGLAIALTLGVEVRYVVFACRPRGRGFDDRADHQRLLREATEALARAERSGQSELAGVAGGHRPARRDSQALG